MKISIIGFGNMAKAMAQGLLRNQSNQLRVSSPSLPIGTNSDGIQTHSDNLSIIPDADVIILAAKPALMQSVIDQIRPALSADCLVISVASGLNLASFKLNCPIVRAMPNIAAALGQSATPLIANKWVTDAQKTMAETIFASMGITAWITEENQMDVFTALSGSGPAYVFLLMESMVNAAIHLGLPKDVATSFALQTVQGAVSLAMNRTMELDALRATVTSPAGTTAAAISVFKDRGLGEIVYDAMRAACDRAIELGR